MEKSEEESSNNVSSNVGEEEEEEEEEEIIPLGKKKKKEEEEWVPTIIKREEEEEEKEQFPDQISEREQQLSPEQQKIVGLVAQECVFHGSWRHREIVFAAIHCAHTDTKISQ
jgi:hypothetical protein